MQRLNSIKIEGYRPFRDLEAELGPLVVLVGANGSGKSSLFEFLRFLRDALYQDIPPEIVPGSIGQQVFHKPGPERFAWNLEIDLGDPLLFYSGELTRPVGRTRISNEQVLGPMTFMHVQEGEGFFDDLAHGKQEIALKRPNQLALSLATNPAMTTLYRLREYLRSWRFYSAFGIANERIRKSVPIEQEPVLAEDAGNLSSVLHYLLTEHPLVFDELQTHLRSAVPGFKSLAVKARGGPGEVIAFWREAGVEGELSLADLSDGTLRLLSWMVLALQPNPPGLICIDEPDQGVHPRTLPLLAGLFDKASQRTQLILATHASYFLMQFPLEQIAVLRRDNGAGRFLRPADSPALVESLEDFGTEEIEVLHRSDELERLSPLSV